MHVEIPVQLLVSVSESAAMDIDVHRQGVPTAQYRVMRQIQVEQMAAARSRGRIVPAIRQVGEVGDYIDVFRRAPAFGTRRIDGDRAKSHSQNARQQVLGNPFEVARGLRPTFRVPEHVLRQAIFRSELRADALQVRHPCRPFLDVRRRCLYR